MKIFIKIVILLTLSFTNLYAEITFDVEEDEFTDTKMENIVDSVGSSITVEKSIENVKGKLFAIYCSEQYCIIGFSAYYDDWNELGTSKAYVLLDDEKWNNHIEFYIDTDVDSDVSESYNFVYTKEFFKEIVQSKSFRAKVGNLVFAIDLTKLPISNFSL